MPDFATFQHGAVAYPLPTGTARSLLRDADPPIYFMLDFYAYALTTYMGARLMESVAAIGAPIAQAVEMKVPYPIEVFEKLEQFKYPLLAIYRMNGKYNYRTKVWEHDVGRFGLSYVLPPMTAAQMENVGPILNSAKTILNYMNDQGWDPAYTPPGGSTGEQAWDAHNAGVEEIGIDTWKIGTFPSQGNLIFPALMIEGVLKERAMLTTKAFSGRSSFTGGDVEIDAVDNTGSVFASVATPSTYPAPSPLSVSPATGTINGGDAITISGTSFVAGATVTIGTILATNVVFVGAGSITCHTPAHNPGPSNIVVTNVDGQSGKLPAAFTFA